MRSAGDKKLIRADTWLHFHLSWRANITVRYELFHRICSPIIYSLNFQSSCHSVYSQTLLCLVPFILQSYASKITLYMYTASYLKCLAYSNSAYHYIFTDILINGTLHWVPWKYFNKCFVNIFNIIWLLPLIPILRSGLQYFLSQHKTFGQIEIFCQHGLKFCLNCNSSSLVVLC